MPYHENNTESSIVPEQVKPLFELVFFQFVLMLMTTLLGYDHHSLIP